MPVSKVRSRFRDPQLKMRGKGGDPTTARQRVADKRQTPELDHDRLRRVCNRSVNQFAAEKNNRGRHYAFFLGKLLWGEMPLGDRIDEVGPAAGFFDFGFFGSRLPRFCPLAIVALLCGCSRRSVEYPGSPVQQRRRAQAHSHRHGLTAAIAHGVDTRFSTAGSSDRQLIPHDVRGTVAATSASQSSGVNLEIIRGHFAALAVRHEFEVHLLAFTQVTQARAFNGADVYECIRPTLIGCDEAEALLAVEPLNGPSRHEKPFQKT
jgi:hypothetical protein